MQVLNLKEIVMKSSLLHIPRFFFRVIVFLLYGSANAQSSLPSDFSLTIAAVLAILVLIVLIFTVIVSFSLKQSVSERYKLSNEEKNSAEKR